MTEAQQNAERYLLKIRDANSQMQEMIYKIEYLRYKASGTGAIRYDKDHVQTSPEDMVCEAIAEAISVENKLYHYHNKILEMRENVQGIIGLWNDNNARFIDIYYLSRGSMGDVAEKIGCSSRNAYFIKLKALDEFSKYI